MCESHTGQKGIKIYLQSKLFDALRFRARAIRFERAKPFDRKEHHWAKVVTFAEAYSRSGPFITGGFYKHG